MKLVAIVVVLVVPACAAESESVPSCIDVGCIEAPSGSPDTWSPCAEPVCFCPTVDDVTACTVEVHQ